MATIACVLYPDSESSHPTSRPRDDALTAESDPDGQTTPALRAIGFNAGNLLGDVSGDLEPCKFLEAGAPYPRTARRRAHAKSSNTSAVNFSSWRTAASAGIRTHSYDAK